MNTGGVWGLTDLVPLFSWGPTPVTLPAAGEPVLLLRPNVKRMLVVVSIAQVAGAGQLARIQSIGDRGAATLAVLTQFYPYAVLPYSVYGAAITGQIVASVIGGMALNVDVTDETMDESRASQLDSED